MIVRRQSIEDVNLVVMNFDSNFNVVINTSNVIMSFTSCPLFSNK